MSGEASDARPIVVINFPFENTSWLGGSYAISHLLNAYQQLPDPRLKLALLTPSDVPQIVAKTLPDIPIWRTRLLSKGSPAHLLRRLVRRATGRDLVMELWLRARGVKAFSHADPLGSGAAIAVIGHIADLGVHHFPELYKSEVSAALHRHIHRTVNNVDTVLLLSRAVEEDFRRFYGETRGKREILHIVPAVPPRNRAQEREAMERYGLPEQFFFLPNKFWVHKNHAVVVEALGILRKRGRAIRVVCSGMTTDERQPDHFGNLMKRAAKLGVEEEFQVLGIIPGEDVATLTRASVALINPSKFEGWGLSVAEAREMGKHIIVSDIPVFREQNPERVSYFAPDDAEALADLLLTAHDSFEPAADDAAQQRAAKIHSDHQRAYARGFEEIVLATIRRRAASA